MLFCNLKLFLIGVAGQLDHFHAIKQSLGNGISCIGRGNKHYIGQIKRQLQEMIAEGAVLLSIQHL